MKVATIMPVILRGYSNISLAFNLSTASCGNDNGLIEDGLGSAMVEPFHSKTVWYNTIMGYLGLNLKVLLPF